MNQFRQPVHILAAFELLAIEHRRSVIRVVYGQIEARLVTSTLTGSSFRFRRTMRRKHWCAMAVGITAGLFIAVVIGVYIAST